MAPVCVPLPRWEIRLRNAMKGPGTLKLAFAAGSWMRKRSGRAT